MYPHSTSTLKDIHVCFLLWQLDNSIKDKDFAHDTVAKILASILKYVLRQWPISTLVDPVQGTTDEKITLSNASHVFLYVVFLSQPWV